MLSQFVTIQHILRTVDGAQDSPPWLRRGGRAVKTISPKASADRRGRGGWFNIHTELFGCWTNPVRARLRWLRSIFWWAQPSRLSQGGEFLRTTTILRAGLLIALLSFGLAISGQSPTTNAPYLNPNLSAEQRAKDLVGRMTLDEKVLQMQNSAPAIPRLN